MIEEIDIKVGNWFEHNANWCFRSPAEIKPFFFKWETRDWYALGECTLDLNDCSPIPLTPELMTKAKFQFRKCGISGADMWQGMSFWQHEKLHLRGNVSTAGGGTLHLEGYFNTQINYLHQLQNLFYSINGTELTIEL